MPPRGAYCLQVGVIGTRSVYDSSYTLGTPGLHEFTRCGAHTVSEAVQRIMLSRRTSNNYLIGVRETLTGYFVPGRVGHGAWITWDLRRRRVVSSSPAGSQTRYCPKDLFFCQHLHKIRAHKIKPQTKLISSILTRQGATF